MEGETEEGGRRKTTSSGHLQDDLPPQVALPRRWRADAEGLVSQPHMRRAAVGFAVDRHSGYACRQEASGRTARGTATVY